MRASDVRRAATLAEKLARIDRELEMVSSSRGVFMSLQVSQRFENAGGQRGLPTIRDCLDITDADLHDAIVGALFGAGLARRRVIVAELAEMGVEDMAAEPALRPAAEEKTNG